MSFVVTFTSHILESITNFHLVLLCFFLHLFCNIFLFYVAFTLADWLWFGYRISWKKQAATTSCLVSEKLLSCLRIVIVGRRRCHFFYYYKFVVTRLERNIPFSVWREQKKKHIPWIWYGRLLCIYMWKMLHSLPILRICKMVSTHYENIWAPWILWAPFYKYESVMQEYRQQLNSWHTKQHTIQNCGMVAFDFEYNLIYGIYLVGLCRLFFSNRSDHVLDGHLIEWLVKRVVTQAYIHSSIWA